MKRPVNSTVVSILNSVRNSGANHNLPLPGLATLQVLHYQYPLPDPIATTMGTVAARPALIIRLEDAEGAVGWGEIWCNFPPGGDSYRARLALSTLPVVLESVQLNSVGAFHELNQGLHRVALQAGEPGPMAQLCAGVDIAITDLRARRQGVAMWVLLARENTFTDTTDALTPAVRAYASGLAPDRFEQQIERMRANGTGILNSA